MKKIIKYLVLLLLIPLTVAIGAVLLHDRQYAIVSLIIVLLTCVPFLISFERGRHPARRVVLLAVMVSLSVAGRFIFAPVPFFKPVTAMVVISAICFGSEFGFMTGALSAIVSNMYFGQGPWTPFQMFAWGLIGFFAGILSNPIKRNRLFLILYSAVSGVVYSLIMDIWTTLWADGAFNPDRFFASVVTSLPVMAVYVVSNVLFIIVLFPLFNKRIERLKDKYGV